MGCIITPHTENYKLFYTPTNQPRDQLISLKTNPQNSNSPLIPTPTPRKKTHKCVRACFVFPFVGTTPIFSTIGSSGFPRPPRLPASVPRVRPLTWTIPRAPPALMDATSATNDRWEREDRKMGESPGFWKSNWSLFLIRLVYELHHVFM